jgi:hypothetical protein
VVGLPHKFDCLTPDAKIVYRNAVHPEFDNKVAFFDDNPVSLKTLE